MTRRLRWREAQQADRPALQQFTCTVPRARDYRGRCLPHQKPWEREVEVGIRNLKPPIGDGCLLLGEDDEGLAAVALVYYLGRSGDTYFAKLAAVAVAQRCRGQGYGREALDVALAAAADRGHGLGCPYVQAIGWVDRRNEASRAMNRSAGLGFIGMSPHEQYEEWGVEMELPAELREGA